MSTTFGATPRSFFTLRRLLFVAILGASVDASARTVWVDHDSRGGSCSDTYTIAENDAAHPWCTLGAAGRNVQAGDTVRVRGGTYSEPMVCGTNPGCSGMCVL